MIKYYPDKTGKFNQRPHYEPKDLDQECERRTIEFLKDIYGKVSFPILTDDLTKLVERHASDLNSYADLTQYGDNVQGITEFFPKVKPKVLLSNALTEADWAENRLRTTLTHELGHVIFHGYLYQFELKDPSSTTVQICKRDDIIAKSGVPGANWMEWQAGDACGAFLMPASYVKKTLCDVADTSKHGITPLETVEKMIARVVEAFQVSEDAARVRLSVLGLIIR